jgi:hypothetical protein
MVVGARDFWGKVFLVACVGVALNGVRALRADGFFSPAPKGNGEGRICSGPSR